MRHLKFRNLAVAGTILFASGLVSAVHAQDADDMKRAVARISVMEGEVSVRRGDAAEWVAGIINAPLLADDRIATGPNSRAEIQFDSSNMIRIGGNAEIHLTALEYNHYQLEVAHGTVTYRVLRPGSVTVELDTPSVSVRPSQVGAYRISVNEAGESQVTARNGNVEVFTPRGSQVVNANQTLMARGSTADPEFQIVGAAGPDDWDRWNDTRDRYLMQASAAYQNVPPGVAGVEDLSGQGTWQNMPEYGNVWSPTVDAGWSPYSCGRWVWEDWYGWTWVGCESWGWAPYHYGRWFSAGSRWYWYPGARGVRHYWSPALVAFFGFGGGGGFGFGFGHVGWVPLAPFETFHPWWGRGFYGGAFGNRVNITNVNIYNSYRNARVFNGVSGVSAENFRGGHFGGVVHASGEQLRSAGLVRGQMPVAPSRENLRFSDRQSAFTPRGGAENTRFFTHQQPAATQRMSFSQQQRGMEQVSRSVGGSVGPVNRGGNTTPGGSQFGRSNESPAGRSNESPASRFNASPSGRSNESSAPAARSEQNGASGWKRFGATSGQSQGGQQGQHFGTQQNPAGRSESRPEGNSFRGNQTPSTQNTRPSQQPGDRGGWNRFGDPGSTQRQATPSGGGARNTPSYNNSPRYSAPQSQSQGRQSAPQQSAPRSYSAPQSAPRSYSPPSAPRSTGGGGGGGGNSRPSSGGGGGGGRSSGGGGGHHR